MSIRVQCKTNLDEYKELDWPTEMVTAPREGDWVEANSGKLLRVVKVTHATREAETMHGFLTREPVLLVELHKL